MQTAVMRISLWTRGVRARGPTPLCSPFPGDCTSQRAALIAPHRGRQRAEQSGAVHPGMPDLHAPRGADSHPWLRGCTSFSLPSLHEAGRQRGCWWAVTSAPFPTHLLPCRSIRRQLTSVLWPGAILLRGSPTDQSSAVCDSGHQAAGGAGMRVPSLGPRKVVTPMRSCRCASLGEAVQGVVPRSNTTACSWLRSIPSE